MKIFNFFLTWTSQILLWAFSLTTLGAASGVVYHWFAPSNDSSGAMQYHAWTVAQATTTTPEAAKKVAAIIESKAAFEVRIWAGIGCGALLGIGGGVLIGFFVATCEFRRLLNLSLIQSTNA